MQSCICLLSLELQSKLIATTSAGFFFFWYAGEDSIFINGSIAPATYFHLCISSCSRHLLCDYDNSWRIEGNVGVSML